MSGYLDKVVSKILSISSLVIYLTDDLFPTLKAGGRTKNSRNTVVLHIITRKFRDREENVSKKLQTFLLCYISNQNLIQDLIHFFHTEFNKFKRL